MKSRNNQVFFKWHPKARVALDGDVCHLVMAVHFAFLCNLTVGATRVFTVMWFLLFNLHFVSEVGFNTASLTRAQLITQQRDFMTRWAQSLEMKQIHLLKSLVFSFTWKFNACFNFYDGSFSRKLHLCVLRTHLCFG